MNDSVLNLSTNNNNDNNNNNNNNNNYPLRDSLRSSQAEGDYKEKLGK